jgi:hypothetical protein
MAAGERPIDCLSTLPSMTAGTYPVWVSLATMADAGSARRQAAVWSAQPALVAKVSPAFSAVASGVCLGAKSPLCTTALSNSPRAPGEATCAKTAVPPADSPAIVTLVGSPPNWRMLCLTQRNAAC